MKKQTSHSQDRNIASDFRRYASFRPFLHDRIFSILIYTGALLVILVFGLAFHIAIDFLILVIILLVAAGLLSFLIEYFRRRRFYRALLVNLATLDRAYLVLETVEEPTFYDGKIFYDALYAVNKSLQEEIRRYADNTREFQEYIEMWIHEVKTPLSALMLINANSKSSSRQAIAVEIQRLDDYTEQVLYFVRAENAEHDYLITKVPLAKLVAAVANRHQSLLCSKQIEFTTTGLDKIVSTDAKWLEFILNQIINNSIKYGATKIAVSAVTKNDRICLRIHDDGIGISEKDLPRIFEKSFTGRNGRSNTKIAPSTGMGLYIAKSLCDRLGHQIEVISEPGQGTTVELTFGQSEFYKVADQRSV